MFKILFGVLMLCLGISVFTTAYAGCVLHPAAIAAYEEVKDVKVTVKCTANVLSPRWGVAGNGISIHTGALPWTLVKGTTSSFNLPSLVLNNSGDYYVYFRGKYKAADKKETAKEAVVTRVRIKRGL